MNQLTIVGHPVPRFQPTRVAFAALRRLNRLLATWSARRRSRAALLSLGDAGLKDIGISRAQALFEYDKPFWRD
jgi:uncharacterized protein YjiS (DUF1127 family)